jgi:hypothetical protein
MRVDWIVSNGGPLLLLEEALLPAWRGTERAGDASTSDYSRACAAGEIALIGVGGCHGLVIGGEVLETSWWPGPERRRGTLVRWVFADDDDHVAECVKSVPDSLLGSVDAILVVRSPELRLFDSAMPGDDIDTPFLSLYLEPGRYALRTARYRPDPRTELVLHTLRWI